MRMGIYLCGPIAGLPFDDARNGWRQLVERRLSVNGIRCHNPLRHLKSEQLKRGDKRSMGSMGARVGCLSTPKGLTARDRFDTLRSELVLCNLLGTTKISVGSMIELGWADLARVPVVLCMEKGNIHEHAMVQELSSWIVPTLDEGIEVIKDLLVP